MKSSSTLPPAKPLDDVRALLRDLPPYDDEAAAAARARDSELTKPAGSLGRLEEIAVFMAGWQGRDRPTMDRPLVAVFAGNHGVAARGVSPFPASVTAAMVANFRAGGAAVNQLCKTFDLSLKVYELALEMPTEDFTAAPAMDERTSSPTVWAARTSDSAAAPRATTVPRSSKSTRPIRWAGSTRSSSALPRAVHFQG